MINLSGNMASLQNRQMSMYQSASGHTNMHLKIHSLPTRMILLNTQNTQARRSLYTCRMYIEFMSRYMNISERSSKLILVPTNLNQQRLKEEI